MATSHTAARISFVFAIHLACAATLCSQEQQGLDQAKANQESRRQIQQAANTLRSKIGASNRSPLDGLLQPQRQKLEVALARQAALAEQIPVERKPAQRPQQLRVCLQLAAGDEVTRFIFTAKQLNALEQKELQENIADELVRKEVAKVAKFIEVLRSACNLSDAQSRKLLLAAETNAKPMMRAVNDWNQAFGGMSLADRQQVLRAQIGLRDLNATVEDLSDRDNLIHKVFSNLLTEDQEAALKASHLTWFADFAFAIGVPPDQRPALENLIAKMAQSIPVDMSQDHFCRQVIDSIPLEELQAILDAELAERIKGAKSPALKRIPAIIIR